ncbi:MAG: preprotein translocase subunit SecA [Oscillospiraceae bacterium]|nr:preprotein translocase subunit SecA [Oscillospiraceae bacterium]
MKHDKAKIDRALQECCKASEKALGLTPFDEQLRAAKSLFSGRIVEMKTGEGKTLSAVFAAFLYVKQDDIPHKVHIFTFNDYLAKRDYHWMKPVYDILGVKIALITEKTTFEERKAAYRDADVIYATVKECGFDFLRDFLVFEESERLHVGDTPEAFKLNSREQSSRENSPSLAFDVAIFDEADSVLIDEARIPLTIAGDVDASVSDEFTRVFEFAQTLTEDDYGVNKENLSVFLTDAGTAKVEERFETDNLYDSDNIELRCNVETAMKALFYLKENKDYVVKNGKIALIDQLSGRVARHRLLPGALQAAVEAKHGLKVTERGVVTGVIPIQFFARQYSHIAGMTGTAELAAEEFELLYGLEVDVIAPHNPSKRVDNEARIYYDNEAKWDAVVAQVKSVHKKKQPVLIGTASIEESETLAAKLKKAGITATVLNAKNDEQEADIIKNAGASGAVTVSTNMAGRGIDIKLGGVDEKSRDKVIKAGGLFIIGTALYENARMNEQLNGRSGRQGDVGETALFIALDDEIMVKHSLRKLIGGWRYPKRPKSGDGEVDGRVLRREVKRIQRIAQGALLEERKRLLRFTMIGEKHRDVIFRKRLEYLDDGDKIMMSAINEIWCDYLEYTSELRTGIHLRAVAGRNPAEEYNIDCERYFHGLEERLTERYDELKSQDSPELFRPKNARTFLMEESGDELVRRPILTNLFSEEDFESNEDNDSDDKK